MNRIEKLRAQLWLAIIFDQPDRQRKLQRQIRRELANDVQCRGEE